MKLRILGSQGPYPGLNGACSGYIVEDERANILIDCGNGVLSRYQKYHKLNDLRYIILTHFHSDHVSDMMVLRYALEIGMKNNEIKGPVNVFCPSEPSNILNELNYNGVFKITLIDNLKEINIGGFEVSFEKMAHPVLTYAVKIKKQHKIFVFSGDTSYNEQLIPFIKNCDLFLCDGNLLNNENGPHLKASEAANISKKAKCKKLLITHLSPRHTKDEYYNEINEIIPNAEIVNDFAVYEI